MRSHVLTAKGSPILRWFAIAPVCALVACAQDAASKAEVADLRKQLSAVRHSQDAMERKLERVDMLLSAAAAKRKESQAAAAREDAKPGVPALTVVKLKPSAGAAPKLDVSTEVVEPPPEILDELPVPAARATAPAAQRDDEDTPAPLEQPGQPDPYDRAMEALRTGNLSGAVTALQQFALDNPRDPRADNALYFAAVGLIGQEELEIAASTLEKLIHSYPASDAVLDGMLKLGECRVKLKQADRARSIYHQVISTYPGTAAADQAQARLASLGP